MNACSRIVRTTTCARALTVFNVSVNCERDSYAEVSSSIVNCVSNRQYNMICFKFRCYNSSPVPRHWRTDSIDGLSYETRETNLTWSYALLPASLAVTKGILVSFYYYAAPTDMFKFSAYPRSSWCALLVVVNRSNLSVANVTSIIDTYARELNCEWDIVTVLRESGYTQQWSILSPI